MSETVLLIIGLALASAALRVSGPLLLGQRALPPWAGPVLTVLPGALITALIVVQVLGPSDSVTVDERLIGLAAAGLVLWWRRSAVIPALIVAAVTVALIRALLG